MPNLTLNYFNGRGRAELTRLIFAAAGQNYTDNRIADWPATKEQAPLGQLPYLDVDGVKLPQSIAIARFAARETGLAGKSNLEQAQADAIVDTLVELVNAYYSKIFPIQDAAEKEAAYKAFIADQGSKGAGNVEKLAGLYGSEGFAVGSALTWADILIFEVTSMLLQKNPELAAAFPKLEAIRANVAKNERITEYIKNRPETPF